MPYITLVTPAVRRKRELASAPKGLGDRIQAKIHGAVDAAPLPATVKRAVKNCPGCKKRVKWINRVEIKIKAKLGISA